MSESEPVPSMRWNATDLDRCEHGRHSIDDCFDCVGGESTGNLFLDSPMERDRWVNPNGRVLVRIGTAVHGEPIWAVIKDKPRTWEV